MKSSILTTIFSRVSGGILSSSRLISGMYRLNAFMAASRQREAMSAPVYPWVTSDKRFSSMSSARGMFLVWIWRTSYLPALSGTPISTSRSNLPGRRRAGSIALGRFVAPITMMFPREPIPSISERSWATTLRSTSPVTSSRLGAMASISSINIMLGDVSWAF